MRYTLLATMKHARASTRGVSVYRRRISLLRERADERGESELPGGATERASIPLIQDLKTSSFLRLRSRRAGQMGQRQPVARSCSPFPLV